MSDMDWLDTRHLERSAMADRHGFWHSLFRETDSDIKLHAVSAVASIASDMGGALDYATRLDWMRRWKHARRS